MYSGRKLAQRFYQFTRSQSSPSYVPRRKQKRAAGRCALHQRVGFRGRLASFARLAGGHEPTSPPGRAPRLLATSCADSFAVSTAPTKTRLPAEKVSCPPLAHKGSFPRAPTCGVLAGSLCRTCTLAHSVASSAAGRGRLLPTKVYSERKLAPALLPLCKLKGTPKLARRKQKRALGSRVAPPAVRGAQSNTRCGAHRATQQGANDHTKSLHVSMSCILALALGLLLRDSSRMI